MSYHAFLERKRMVDPMTGMVEAPPFPSFLFPHQRDIVRWALRRGRAAIFAGTGLGKTLMELVWGAEVARFTGKPVIIFAPLAVSAQHMREAERFGIAARMVRSQADVGPGINVTNYQKIGAFDLSAFGGVVLDESSILKSTDGHYRTRLVEECAAIPFRLAATATPAPNDFMELGNHAEFLGVMSYTDMLATFFVHDGGETQKWRLKGHAENEFWKWMASWAVMLRKPSDLGYPNDGYDLPPLHQTQHTVAVDYAPSLDTGLLFPIEARSMKERLSARRDTVAERVAMTFQIVTGKKLCDKLAECGSQNTPSAGASAHPKTPSIAQSEMPNPSPTRRSGGSTCASGASETPTACEPTDRSGLSNATNKGASATHLIQNTGRRRLLPRNGETGKRGEMPASGPSSASLPPTMTSACASKTGYALSVAEGRETRGGTASTSTTATIQDGSGGFSVPHAIPGSVNSATTSIGSPAPSNTFTGLVSEPWFIWCNLNSEQDALERAFDGLCISVRGNMPDHEKEAAILAWVAGEKPVMISKPSIMGFGLNFQHCRNTAFVGLSDSFEQVYQAIRRFWRFGQTKPVNVHFIAAETEGAVVANIRRKEADAERMAAAMVRHMADLSAQTIRGAVRERPDYAPAQPVIIPDFLRL